MVYRTYIVVLLALLLLVRCSRTPKAPITTWIEVPIYPNAQVIQHERSTSETWIFTTTWPMSDVLKWYDDTYLSSGWFDTRGSPSSQIYFRWYNMRFDKCSIFNVYIEYRQKTKDYVHSLSRDDNRDCK